MVQFVKVADLASLIYTAEESWADTFSEIVQFVIVRMLDVVVQAAAHLFVTRFFEKVTLVRVMVDDELTKVMYSSAVFSDIMVDDKVAVQLLPQYRTGVSGE